MRYSSLPFERPQAAALLALALAGGPVHDRSEKLNGPLEYETVVGDVDEFRVTPGGDWVVYRARPDGTHPGLYAMRSDRTLGPVRVSLAGQDVRSFAIHGPRVVYAVGDDLYEVGLDLVPVQLNAPLPSGWELADYRAVGTRVLYRIERTVNGPRQLFSVPIDGGPAVPLSPAPVGNSDRNVKAFVVSGANAFLLANLGTRDELFRVPLDGSAEPVPVCGSFAAGGNVTDVELTPDGRTLVYQADQIVATRPELFALAVDGSAPRLRLRTGGDVREFTLDPTGTRALYRKGDGVYSGPVDAHALPVRIIEGERDELPAVSPSGTHVVYESSDQVYSVRIDGSQPALQLSGLPAARLFLIAITPDSSRVVYLWRNPVPTAWQLDSVPIDGSAPAVKLTSGVAPNSLVSYRFDPEGRHVVYHLRGGHVFLDPTLGLFAVPVDGSSLPSALTPPLRPSTHVTEDYVVDGGAVFFRGDLQQGGADELHRVPLDGSEPVSVLNDRLIAPVVADVEDVAVSPDGRWAVYATSQGVFRVALQGAKEVRRLAAPEGFLSSFHGLLIGHDSRQVFFLAVNDVSGIQPFSVSMDGSAPAIQLGSDVYNGTDSGATLTRLSPDGTWLLYGYFIAGVGGWEGTNLRRVDGGAQPPPFDGRDADFADGGSRLLYRRGGGGYYFTSTRLFVRPTDGSAPELELAPYPVGTPGTVAAFEPCAGERVVYCCDQGGPFELFSVPLDGSEPPRRISDAMGVNRDVGWSFVVTPDGHHVVYAADRDTNEVFELYVAPVDGSSAPLELSGPMVPGGDVVESMSAGVRISADSRRAIYLADQEGNDRYELFSVPLDGSAPPVKLNGPLVEGGDVGFLHDLSPITPDGTRVVYRADQVEDERHELWSVPIDGSGPPVSIAGAHVYASFVTLESEDAVLFLGDLIGDGDTELWLAPLDGSRPPTRRCAPAHPGADVSWPFVVAPDEGHVFYRADEEVDGVVELFRFPIRRVPYHATR